MIKKIEARVIEKPRESAVMFPQYLSSLKRGCYQSKGQHLFAHISCKNDKISSRQVVPLFVFILYVKNTNISKNMPFAVYSRGSQSHFRVTPLKDHLTQ